MSRRHRIIFCAVLAACGSNKKELEAAKHSLYDADFAAVYSAALGATRELYPNIDENPGPGRIATAWHQVQYSNCAGAGSTCDDMVNPAVISQGQGLGSQQASPGAAAAGMPTRLAYKRFFIRFDIIVMGGRPWRVKVTGHASEWEPGAAMPNELHGQARPHWLEGRSDALQIAIYKKIRQYAVPMKQEEAKTTAEGELPKTDPATFKGVPGEAAKRLAEVKDALAKRDYDGLVPQLADDIVWSLGGGTGADAAMALWKADPIAFEAMTAAIAAGCVADNDNRVACPGGPPVPGNYQLIVELKPPGWRVTSFVKAE